MPSILKLLIRFLNLNIKMHPTIKKKCNTLIPFLSYNLTYHIKKIIQAVCNKKMCLRFSDVPENRDGPIFEMTVPVARDSLLGPENPK